jgi:hypothetical protein
MGRREELLRSEAEGWAELERWLAPARPDRLERPGLNEQGWSVRDLLWHLAFWCADTERAFERMRAGTFDPAGEPDGPAQIDRINDEQLARSRAMRLELVRAELHRARAGMLERFGELTELTPEADQWFDETGPLHYAKHLPEVRAWLAGAGGAS